MSAPVLERPPSIYTSEEESSSEYSPTEHVSLQERHPDWPILNIRFYFSPHGTKTDSKEIAPYLDKTDIYLAENISTQVVDAFQTISDSPPARQNSTIRRMGFGKEQLKGSFFEPIVRGLHGTKKLIGRLDINEDSPEELQLKKKIETPHELPQGSSFEEALDKYEKRVAEQAENQDKREKIMAVRFEGEIARLLEANPQMRERSSLNVLISMGAYHTRLTQAFAEQGIPTERDFSSSTYVYDHATELQRTFAYGRKPSQELLEKAYTTQALLKQVYSGIKDVKEVSHDDFFKYMRTMVDQLSPQDRRSVYEQYHNGSLTTNSINKILETHGLKNLPRYSQELSPSLVNEQSRVTRRFRSMGRKALRLIRIGE